MVAVIIFNYAKLNMANMLMVPYGLMGICVPYLDSNFPF